MKVKFNQKNPVLPISDELIALLTKVITSKQLSLTNLADITFNFRDNSYDPVLGGYHPVEIRCISSNDQWEFDYITDFCYVGSGFNTELTKEIDFDFTNDGGFQLYSGHHKLAALSELFQLWQSNFIQYVEQDIFTISTSTS